MRALICATVFALGFTASGSAQSLTRHWMSAEEIRSEFSGIRVAGQYPSRIEWAEEIRSDGTTLYEEGAERRPGRWSAESDLFCFVYKELQQGGCFRVVKHSPNCYELYTATIGGIPPPTPPPAASMSWNGRMWRAAIPQTCDEKPMS